MRTLIITVGTSLLTNTGWRRGQDVPPLPDLLGTLQQTDPTRTSAETHTLYRLGLNKTDQLAWLHSATEEGHVCARALQEHYTASGYQCSLHEIGGLGYQEATFADQGLRALLDVTFVLIRKAGGPDHVAICATGGFKAQLAYLNLVGLLMGIEVYYLHEDFATLVELPRLPLDWDISWVETTKAFFEWIDGEPRTTAQVESWLRATPQLRALVIEDETGHSYLSAPGDLLFRAYRERVAMGPRATWPRASGSAPHGPGRAGARHMRRIASPVRGTIEFMVGSALSDKSLRLTV